MVVLLCRVKRNPKKFENLGIDKKNLCISQKIHFPVKNRMILKLKIWVPISQLFIILVVDNHFLLILGQQNGYQNF